MARSHRRAGNDGQGASLGVVRSLLEPVGKCFVLREKRLDDLGHIQWFLAPRDIEVLFGDDTRIVTGRENKRYFAKTLRAQAQPG